jgi:hypothetical protein
LAESSALEPAAKALARAIYQDTRLRPAIEEPVARVLLGAQPAAEMAQQRELAEVVSAVRGGEEGVRRRLLSALGEELSCELVVLVGGEPNNPRARVMRVSEARMLAVVLAAGRGSPDGAIPWDWRDAVGLLRGVLHGPSPGPRTPTGAVAGGSTAPAKGQAAAKRRAPKAAGSAAAADESESADDDDDVDLLASPWFWGGLGTVVAVGVTVLVLSQTALNEPDSVLLEGRVSP